MGDYKINIVNLNVTNNYVELTAELEGDKELYYPRISACFYGENDNRILPMDLKSCNKNKAIATGIFDTPFLFYNDRKSQNVRVNFLFSDGNGESIMATNRCQICRRRSFSGPIRKTRWPRWRA